MLSGAEFPEFPLPPYSGIFARCEKCGLTGRLSSRYIDLRPMLAKADFGPDSGIAPEYQERSCRNCDYTWAEDIAR